MNVLVISLMFGAFVSIVFYQAYRIIIEVPDEDRAFLDRPEIGFRLVWPLIQLFVHYFGSYIGEAQKDMTHFRLKQAGVEYSLSADQFIAAKYISMCSFVLVFHILLVLAKIDSIFIALCIGVIGYFYPELWLRGATAKRKGSILKSLPFYLDIITLSVEAGSNLTGGLTQAVMKSADSPLRSEISRVLRDIRAGKTRAESLRAMSDRAGSQSLSSVVSSMIQAEKSGSSLGPILRAQAEQLRSERFQRAEKLAMEAPVKLLAPLVMFIFPTTFLVLGFLVLSKAIIEQIITFTPIVWAYSWPG